MTRPELDLRAIFGQKVVDAMNDVAELVQIHRSIYEIQTEFRDSPEIDYKVAKPRANLILKTTKEAAVSLLEAVMLGKTELKLLAEVSEVHSGYCEKIGNAIMEAEKLASQERAAFGQSGAKGNFVSVRIHGPLDRLAEKWYGTSSS